jgi:glutamine synthetase
VVSRHCESRSGAARCFSVSDPSAAEYEFYQFRAPQSHDGPERNSSSTATFLRDNPVNSLPPLTEGMFGYSITRPVHNQDYYYGIFNTCAQFNCGIEGWHTESGPGVFEAVRPVPPPTST